MSDIASAIDDSFLPTTWPAPPDADLKASYEYNGPRDGHWEVSSSNGSYIDDGSTIFGDAAKSVAGHNHAAPLPAGRVKTIREGLAQRLMRATFEEKFVARQAEKQAVGKEEAVAESARAPSVMEEKQPPKHFMVPHLTPLRREILERQERVAKEREVMAAAKVAKARDTAQKDATLLASGGNAGSSRSTFEASSGKCMIRILGKNGEEAFVQIPQRLTAPRSSRQTAAEEEAHAEKSPEHKKADSPTLKQPLQQTAQKLERLKQSKKEEKQQQAKTNPKPPKVQKYRAPTVESDHGSTGNEEMGLDTLMSGALPSPSQQAASIAKSSHQSAHEMAQASEHGSRVSKADSGISQAVLSIAQKIAKMPPSNAPKPASAARSNEDFKAVGEGVSLALHFTAKGSEQGSAHAGFHETGTEVVDGAASKPASIRSAQTGFREIGIGRTRPIHNTAGLTRKSANSAPGWTAASHEPALPSHHEAGRGSKRRASSQVKASPQRSAESSQTIVHSFGGFGTFDEAQAADNSASQRSGERFSASRVASGPSVQSSTACPSGPLGPATRGGRTHRLASSYSQHSQYQGSVRQSVKAESLRERRETSWQYRDPGINSPAPSRRSITASALGRPSREPSVASTSPSSISIQPSPYPYASGQSTPFAGQGWISPHPLSVASSHVGTQPERAVKLPGQDAELTYDEWKIQRDLKDEVMSHLGSRFGTVSRVPSLAASRIVSPVYNAEPTPEYVGSYWVGVHHDHEQAPRSERDRSRQSVVKERLIPKAWSGRQLQSFGPEPAPASETVQSWHGRERTTPAHSYKPASTPTLDSPARASGEPSWQNPPPYAVSDVASTPSHYSPAPASRKASLDPQSQHSVSATPSYTVGLTPADLQTYQAQLEETVSRLSAQLSQVEQERNAPQPDYSNWKRHFSRSPAPSPQASLHRSSSHSLPYPHGHTELGMPGSQASSGGRAASLRSGSTVQMEAGRSVRQSTTSIHDYAHPPASASSDAIPSQTSPPDHQFRSNLSYPRVQVQLPMPWDAPASQINVSPASERSLARLVADREASRHSSVSRHTQASRAGGARSVSSGSRLVAAQSQATYGTADWQELEDAEDGRGGFRSKLW